jgi:uncharacterized membrane protein ArfB
MDFVIQWFWYLLAFAAGSLVAMLISAVSIKHSSEQDALAALRESAETGGQ